MKTKSKCFGVIGGLVVCILLLGTPAIAYTIIFPPIEPPPIPQPQYIVLDSVLISFDAVGYRNTGSIERLKGAVKYCERKRCATLLPVTAWSAQPAGCEIPPQIDNPITAFEIDNFFSFFCYYPILVIKLYYLWKTENRMDEKWAP